MLPGSFSGGTGIHEGIKVSLIHELVDLIHPVSNQCGGTDHNGGQGSKLHGLRLLWHRSKENTSTFSFYKKVKEHGYYLRYKHAINLLDFFFSMYTCTLKRASQMVLHSLCLKSNILGNQVMVSVFYHINCFIFEFPKFQEIVSKPTSK